MPDVGTTFGNGVNAATQSAAVFGLEAAGLDLYFLDEIGLEVLADAAVLNVGGVDAIDQVNILTVACAVDLETPGAARCTTLHRLLSRAPSVHVARVGHVKVDRVSPGKRPAIIFDPINLAGR